MWLILVRIQYCRPIIKSFIGIVHTVVFGASILLKNYLISFSTIWNKVSSLAVTLIHLVGVHSF